MCGAVFYHEVGYVFVHDLVPPELQRYRFAFDTDGGLQHNGVAASVYRLEMGSSGGVMEKSENWRDPTRGEQTGQFSKEG